MKRRGRERRGRPAPAPVAVRTEFAQAEIVAEASARTLFLDGREAGVVDLDDPRRLVFAYMRRIADLIDAFRPSGSAIDVFHVGGGACALPRYVEVTRPRSRQLVWEIDPGVVALAREHLGLRHFPRLRVKVGDAAELIRARPDRSADLVIGDAFDGPHVPAPLSTPAFAAQVRRVLRPAGVYALNVIDIPPLEEVKLHDALLRDAFTHVAWVAPPGVLRERAPGNVVLFGSDVPLPLDALHRAAAAAVPREQLLVRA
ncbi:fused MFS/spermidine synthase [Solirubrobacter sp. CPCC 204708]|uniref:Fused MFS/spermidine synthase n=1 Tax=Solirubrobacter deserti TaxID=2282478 RepID=A0ABT4RN78_9ACTN|nr:fused MFS/spermidine synthase [Solirubrobacter deserti]MBE2317443.1 fused MFS/spermidine synthase [Solirubrobacter deserti]MDA0140025.1 fused MFS/spermidine synthase [Solirubrobacter deserti]